MVVKCSKADELCPEWCGHQVDHTPKATYLGLGVGECHEVNDPCSNVRGRGMVKCEEVLDA